MHFIISITPELSKCVQYYCSDLKRKPRVFVFAADETAPAAGAHRVTSSKVGFLPNTAHPHPTMPVDLSKETFLSMDDVQTSALPKGQVSVVMNSYDKTIGT